MSLRLRLTLVVAITFALVVVGSVYAAHVSASRQLKSQTDQFLVQRSERFTHVAPNELPHGGQDADDGGGPTGPALADPDTVTQLLDRQGRVISSINGQPRLPIDAHDRAIASSGGRMHFRDASVGNERYRVLTVALPGGGAAQIGRGIDANTDVLAALDFRLLLIALAGTIVAASLAWIIARRMVRPIERLTSSAMYVAQTQDLANPIDVTRRDEVGRLASSFNSMLAALRTSREQQRRLVLDASHELRTPLTALRTNIDLLRRAHTLGDGERAELLGETDVELRELTDLVSELVELATDTRAEEPEQLADLGDLVDRVVTRAQRRTGRDISLELHEPAWVDARVAMLERAISNLLDNALKFSAPDSAIEVEVRHATVEVRDHGTGVATGDLPYVFDRFYRAPSARTFPGSGLGLAIVKQIVDLHRGTVVLEGRAGGGTTARVQLAEVRPSADGASSGSAQSSAPATRATPSS